jgi:hypothetical protein
VESASGETSGDAAPGADAASASGEGAAPQNVESASGEGAAPQNVESASGEPAEGNAAVSGLPGADAGAPPGGEQATRAFPSVPADDAPANGSRSVTSGDPLAQRERPDA